MYSMLFGNNSGGGANALLDGASFYLELTHTAVPQRGAITPSFTRATTETGQKWDDAGYLDFTALAGEAVFKGARRERNLIPTSSDVTSATWSGVRATKVTVAGYDGLSTATKLISTGALTSRFLIAANTFPATGTFQLYAYIKNNGNPWVIFGTDNSAGKAVWFNVATGAVGTQSTGYVGAIEAADNGYYLCSIKIDRATASVLTNLLVAPVDADGSVLSTAANGVELVSVQYPMLCDITGETDQTTIRPYVSVGALDYRSTQDPLYLSLPGTAGHYASTPDSVAVSITGDVDIRVRATLTDWTPSTSGFLVAHASVGPTAYNYMLRVDAAGTLAFVFSVAGSVVTKASTVVTGFADGATKWVRATQDVDNGAAGYDTKFYTSDDGVTWTQLGTTVTTATAITRDNAASSLFIGEAAGGVSGATFAGKIYSAQIYDTIDGTTPVVDFNPHRDATTPTGTITSSTTGEVWTINGASSVVRNAAYHGSMVDGVKCYDTDRSGNPISTSGSYPLVGYVPWEARTNLALQSNAFTTAPWGTAGTPSLTKNAVGVDGFANSAWTVTVSQGDEYNQLSATLTAAIYTRSIKIKKTTGAQTAYPIVTANGAGGTVIALATINTSTGVGTLWTSYVGWTIASNAAVRVTSYNADFWLVELSFTATVANWAFGYIGVMTTNATKSSGSFADADITGAAGTHVMQDLMLELGSFATPYIPTTTVAVARAANWLKYPAVGGVTDSEGWAYAEIGPAPYANTGANATVFVGFGFPTGMLNSGSRNSTQITSYDGTTIVEKTGITSIQTGSRKRAITWGGSTQLAAGDGATPASGAFDGTMGVSTYIHIGCNSGGNQHANAPVVNVRAGIRKLSNSELQAITA